MSLNTIIRSAITPIVPECVPDQYSGTGAEYCTFDYSELPDCFGDNTATAIRYLVQLHWFLPCEENPYVKKKRIKQALVSAGLTYPSVTNASDADGQHIIFETEYVDGDV